MHTQDLLFLWRPTRRPHALKVNEGNELLAFLKALLTDGPTDRLRDHRINPLIEILVHF